MNSSVERHFSKAATAYHRSAHFQRELARRVLELSPEIRRGSALDVGCGTGYLAGELARRYPQLGIDAIDISRAMLAEGSAHYSDCTNIRWQRADVLDLEFDNHYDIVLSGAALQWIIPFSAAAEKLISLIKPQGFLLAAVVTHGTFSELHELKDRIAPSKPLTNSLPHADHVVVELERAGFILEHQEELCAEQAYSSAREFLHSIRELGFTARPTGTGQERLTRGELASLVEAYDGRFKGAKEVVATQKAILLRARKP